MTVPIEARHADLVGVLVLGAIAVLIALAGVRPELWERLFLGRIDPRPLGLMRIALGLVVLWTFLCLLPDIRLFFTDEGMWLTSMARSWWGGPLRWLWDPVDGFEHWWSPLRAALTLPSVLHLRSDPPVAFTLYGLLLVSLALMVLGVWTRWTSIASWLLAEQLYRYNGLFYTGGDFVLRSFLFLGMLSQWGEAYSIDGWRRRRRLLLAGATTYPAPRPIPAWPQRLMMLQLASVYAATGLLKTGVTWQDGTALYYALNLEHFYRMPAQWLIATIHHAGILPFFTWVTRWWETLFPLALVGVVLRAYEAERCAGTWPTVGPWRRRLSRLLLLAAWLAGAAVGGIAASYYLRDSLPVNLGREETQAAVTIVIALAPVGLVAVYRWLRRRHPGAHRFLLHWLLGKRVWLVFGVLLHVGIDVSMNIGTFSQAIMVPYLCWLSGREIEAFWRYLVARVARGTYAIHYRPDEAGVRRAALLRLWDFGHRIRFVPDDDLPVDKLRLDIEGRRRGIEGAEAAAALVRAFPALWWLGPPAALPFARRWTGALALRLLW